MKDIISNERLAEYHEEIRRYHRGLPNPGKHLGNLLYEGGMKRIDDSFWMCNSLYGIELDNNVNFKFFDSGDGGPLLSTPYPVAVEYCKRAVCSADIKKYGFASGDKKCREKVADYLSKNGFKTRPGEAINVNQIIFTNSVTEAFSLLMRVICRPGDVVLFTAPTYGLLTYCPERAGARSRFVPLKKENDWLIDTDDLEFYIMKINEELSRSNNYPYKTRVVAFVNINPHNPTGKVMNGQHESLLKGICYVCQRNGVYVIDDLIYQLLCYDVENRAYPIATIEGEFENTITLFGISKCFGMPAARAGGIFANEMVIRGIRNEIFQMMDSTSLIVSYLMAGAFNTDKGNESIFHEYMTHNVSLYMANWRLLERILTGNIGDMNQKQSVLMREYFLDDYFDEKAGFPYVSIVDNLIPESGFFAVLDFSQLVGKRVKELGVILKNEEDVLVFMYKYARVKLLPGSSMAWPDKDRVVARFSYAFDEESLIKMFSQIYYVIKRMII